MCKSVYKCEGCGGEAVLPADGLYVCKDCNFIMYPLTDELDEQFIDVFLSVQSLPVEKRNLLLALVVDTMFSKKT